ncbi:unnamed protein product [Acanthoscelides obtectus]|uniref:Uncharacterized protein n=1 Tax=Acanthoscelides obtectus TaxID=200917 RepID=A0A9P0JVS0_ACAOB|nr:unnamed protein product [Acanthoscelides obtectus]CAK1640238.1 hypothetical protein AOBTE_LOCUS11614 [Acanthoscelides obtectus]
MTNRIEGIEDFKHQLKYYGYRGESLASITECSKSVNITSRARVAGYLRCAEPCFQKIYPRCYKYFTNS